MLPFLIRLHSKNGRSCQRMASIRISEADRVTLQKRGYTVGTLIAAGGFAHVHRATRNGAPCAVKVIDLSKTSPDYRLKFLPRELFAMKRLKHQYIIVVYDIFSISGSLVTVFMELAEGGDLVDLIKEEKVVGESRARKYYNQFGDALRYMHSISIAHRDIKCENVLLNKPRTVAKLSDFGFARQCTDSKTKVRLMSDTFCGSAAYVAPEVLRNTSYCPLRSDVWSMGVLLFMLLNSRLPFLDLDTSKLQKLQLESKYTFAASRRITKEGQNLITAHLNPNPTLRPTMLEVFQHPWFTLDLEHTSR